MKENRKILLALAGSITVGLGIYMILRVTMHELKEPPKEDNILLLPDHKERSTSAEEFVERRRQRAMAKQTVREEVESDI